MKKRPDNTILDTFSAERVIELLTSVGVITGAVAETIRRGYGSRVAALRSQLKESGVADPVVSPLEIIASFELPSTNPRNPHMAEAEVCMHFARASGIPFTRIDPLKLDAKRLCSIVSKPFARKHLLVPVSLESRRLRVAMVNPFDPEAIQNLEDVTGYEIVPVLGIRSEILKTINEIFAFEHSLQKAEALRSTARDLGNLEQLVDVMTDQELDASDQHVVKAVDLLLQYAFDQRASDIHIEPKREHAVVRLRIDGRLHNTHSVTKHVYPAFVSRLKIMARMDIAEKRRAQDGRIKTVFRDTEIELRVSTVPVAFGEKIVIRVFDPQVLLQDLGSLGFLGDQLVVFRRLLARPHGIILVTGPTGSGKTTTLYSSLQHLSSPEVNIVTIEDPIEMVHEPFNQIGVRENSGVTFAGALRSVLRQDPDIIMVGEIRDRETAQYAVQSALTGHLVLSTLHTNTAVGAITRLVDLGIEPFLIASTVIGVVAQRLLRCVCPNCDEPGAVTADERRLLRLAEAADTGGIRRGAGCDKCRNTGYRGRTAAFEMLEVNERISAMIRDETDESELTSESRRTGNAPLMQSAVHKLLTGATSVEEILRVIPLSR